MNKKIIINGKIEVMTGMHIGGDTGYSAIGMVDSIVIKDKMTKLPIIPGSSLKGKMRTLLSKSINNSTVDFDNDGEAVLRLFGSSKKGAIKPARLQFCDCFLANKSDFTTISPYEIKCENTINRINAIANPRQIERVVKGAKFDLLITYNIDNDDEIDVDMTNLIQALKLLQLDFLGGGGSRGNGRIMFQDLSASNLDENCKIVDNEELTKKLNEVGEYGKKCYQV